MRGAHGPPALKTTRARICSLPSSSTSHEDPSYSSFVTCVWLRTSAPCSAALRAFNVQSRNGSMPYSSIVTAPSVPAAMPGSISCSSASLRRVCGLPFLSGWYLSYSSM